MLHHPFDGTDELTHNRKLQQSERRWQGMQCWGHRDCTDRKHPPVTNQKWRKQEPEVAFHSQWLQKTNCIPERCTRVRTGCSEILPWDTTRFSDNRNGNSDLNTSTHNASNNDTFLKHTASLTMTLKIFKFSYTTRRWNITEIAPTSECTSTHLLGIRRESEDVPVNILPACFLMLLFILVCVPDCKN